MSSDRNTQLMKSMGSKSGRYDPEPPDQWKWQLEHGAPEERLLAWVKSGTIAFGHQSPFVVDEHGKALYLQHAATELGWELKTAQNVASRLASQGRIRLDKNNKRIFLRAEVVPEKQEPESDERRNLGEIPSLYNGNYPTYVVDFIQNLPPEKRDVAIRKYDSFWDWNLKGLANSVAAWRAIAAPYEDNILREIGMDKKRLPKRRNQETGAIQLQLLEIPAFVQTNGHGGMYKGENGICTAENRERTNGASLLSSDTDSDVISSSSSRVIEEQPRRRTKTPPKAESPDKWREVTDYIREKDIQVNDQQIAGFLVECCKARPTLEPDFLLSVLTDWRIGPRAISPLAIWQAKVPAFLRDDRRVELWNSRSRQTNGGFTYAFAPSAKEYGDD